MKKLAISLTIFLAAAISITLIAFSGSETNEIYAEVQQEKPKDEKASCCATGHGEMSKGEFTENSIYQVNSDWTNQNGDKVNIGNLRGKTQVFSMIFANCTYACPILANDMRRIEKALSQSELQNVEFTLISIDPERDTPARLRQFAEDQMLNSSRWRLLTGERSDIDDLAALIGFRYKKENDGSFSHSNIITILNENGEIVHQQVGLNQEIKQTVEVIKNQNKQGA